jgi:hypothetical protein
VPHVSLSGLPDDERSRVEDALRDGDVLGARDERALRFGGNRADASDLVQRALHAREFDQGVVLDGWTAKPIATLPTTQSIDTREYERGDLYEVDDHVSTPDELIADEDARRTERIRRRGGQSEDGGTYADLHECQANRVTHAPGGGKGTGKAKPLKGATADQLHERLLMSGPDEKHLRPLVVAGRVSAESKDILDADKTASNGEIMDEIGILMQKTGKTKAEIIDLLRRSGETGCFDPEVVDAMPKPPAGNGAAA